MEHLVVGKRVQGAALLIAALRNMASAVEAAASQGGNDELIVSAGIECGQAWQNDPSAWTVFEGWIHFSAGPNAVFTSPTSEGLNAVFASPTPEGL